MSKIHHKYTTVDNHGSEPSTTSRVRRIATLKIMACILLPIAVAAVWFLSGLNWFLLLLLSLPMFAVEEWIGEKWVSRFLNKQSRWSVENSGFSVLRIIIGVLAVSLFFAVVYGLYILIHFLRTSI